MIVRAKNHACCAPVEPDAYDGLPLSVLGARQRVGVRKRLDEKPAFLVPAKVVIKANDGFNADQKVANAVALIG